MPPEPRKPISATPDRSRIMRAVRREGTRPERDLERALNSLGLVFRRHERSLPGSPDFVFPEKRVAVFVHGCFWHRHRNCKLATTPRSNLDYWRAKFAANQKRDRAKVASLRRMGWSVITVWQCQIEKDRDAVVRRVVALLEKASHSVVTKRQRSTRKSGSMEGR